jgi:hypothetical protein
MLLATRWSLRAGKRQFADIARRLRRPTSTVSREVARNGGCTDYRATLAHRATNERARRPKERKLVECPRLAAVVEAGLTTRWSPAEVSARLVVDYPGDLEMRVSAATIPLPHPLQSNHAGSPGTTDQVRGVPTGATFRRMSSPSNHDRLSFAMDIKPLFRQLDRESMEKAFDLWSLDDVRAHAPEILEHVKNGSMPCDGAWPQERVQIFERWIESGMGS